MPITHVSCTNIDMPKKLKNNQTNDSQNDCDWFLNNKLSIHFGEDKTKSILFASINKKTSKIKYVI